MRVEFTPRAIIRRRYISIRSFWYRFVASVSFLLLAIYVVPTVLIPVWADEPIAISDCTELQLIGNDAGYPLSGDYVLEGDIDCSASQTWNENLAEWDNGSTTGNVIPDPYTGVTNNGYYGFLPIGSDGDRFTGTFDGAGYSIRNIWIFRKAENNVGLFGVVEGATISDVRIEDSNIVGAQSTGGLAGASFTSTISGISVQDSMIRAYLSYYGGGVLGTSNDSILSNLQVSGGAVHGSGNVIGGLVGFLNGGEVSDSNTSTPVDGGVEIGGAFGRVANATITGVNASGLVYADYSDYAYATLNKYGNTAGGLIGSMSNATVTNSMATGNVRGMGSDVGGFVGRAVDVYMENVRADNDVTLLATSPVFEFPKENIGGLIGYASGLTLKDSHAEGSTIISDNGITVDVSKVGGLIGFAEDVLVEDSYARVDILVDAGFDGQVTSVGGLMGLVRVNALVESTLENVSAEGVVTGDISVGGLAGTADNTRITDARASSTIRTSGYIGSKDYFGGLFGQASRVTIDDGEVLVDIDLAVAEGDSIGSVGGIIGSAVSQIQMQDTTARGVISLAVSDPNNSSVQYIGGVAGIYCSSEECGITRVESAVQVAIVTSNPTPGNNFVIRDVGGFIGRAYLIADTIEESLAAGEMTVTIDGSLNSTVSRVGGFFGSIEDSNGGQVLNNYTTSAITITGANRLETVGGFIGYVYQNGLQIDTSYSASDVRFEFATGDYLGGFIGLEEWGGGEYGSTTASFRVGSFVTIGTPVEPGSIGGFAGRVEADSFFEDIYVWHTGDNNNCYAPDSLVTFTCTVAPSAEYFKTNVTAPLSLWNFSSIWAFDSGVNSGFPIFKRSATSPSANVPEEEKGSQATRVGVRNSTTISTSTASSSIGVDSDLINRLLKINNKVNEILAYLHGGEEYTSACFPGTENNLLNRLLKINSKVHEMLAYLQKSDEHVLRCTPEPQQ
jgi:hypothetical protein